MATGSSSEAAKVAKAAKAALAQVLRQRVALWADLDAELGRLVDLALAQIVSQLAGAPSDYQQWVLPRLTQGVQRLADELAVKAGTKAASGLRQAWGLGERAVQAPVAAAQAAETQKPGATPLIPAANPTLALGAPDLRQLRALQAVNTHLISGATSDLVNKVNRELGQVLLGTRTPFEAMQAVSTLLPDRTKNQVRGIVTTNLGTAFNTASFRALQAQAARDPKIRKQWRRSGKRHARWNHDLADGQVQDVNVPFELTAGNGQGMVKLMHPGDPAAPVGEIMHCGCVVLAWKASWKMRVPGAKALTDEELAQRKEDLAQRDGKRLAPRRAAGKATGTKKPA